MNARPRRPSRMRGAPPLAAALLGALAVASPPEPPIVHEASDGPCRVRVEASPPSLLVGEPLVLRLVAEGPRDATIELPEPLPSPPEEPAGAGASQPEARLGAWAVERAEAPRRILLPDGLRVERTLVLRAWDAGAIEVPALGFSFTLPDGGRRELRTAPIPFEVQSLVAAPFDPQAYDPLGAPAPLPTERSWLLPLALGAALLVALALGAVAALRRGRRPAAPPPWPEETALARLDRLEREGLAERGETEPFFVELTTIVRDYLEARLGLRAPEQTTPEFLAAAGASPRLTPPLREALGSILALGDLVKFARGRAAREECRAALAAAGRVVRELDPRRVPAAGAASPAPPQEVAA